MVRQVPNIFLQDAEDEVVSLVGGPAFAECEATSEKPDGFDCNSGLNGKHMDHRFGTWKTKGQGRVVLKSSFWGGPLHCVVARPQELGSLLLFDFGTWSSCEQVKPIDVSQKIMDLASLGPTFASSLSMTTTYGPPK